MLKDIEFFLPKNAKMSAIGEKIQNYPSRIKFVENPSILLILTAVNSDGLVLKYIPHEKRPEFVKLAAVKQHGYAIQFINNPSQTVCLEAVKSKGHAIQFIKNPAHEICEQAINTRSDSIFLIPTEYITLKLCETAIKKNPNIVEKVTSKFNLTNDDISRLQMLAINIDPLSIKYINNQTSDLCIYAITQCAQTISLIVNPTKDMVIQAVSKNPLVYNKIHPQYIDDDINNILLDISGYFLRLIPNPTREMFFKAIKSTPLIIYNMPSLTEDMYIEAIKNDPRAILKTPYISNKMTYEMVNAMNLPYMAKLNECTRKHLLRKIKEVDENIFEALIHNDILRVVV